MKKEISPVIQYLIGLVALTSLVVGLVVSFDSFKFAEVETPTSTVRVNPFKKVNLEAKAAFVYEPDTGRVFYSKDENTSLPIASVTKLMTTLTASEILPDSTVVAFSANRHYRVKNIVALTLVSSSNDGAIALASATRETLGRDLVTEMNIEAASLGLTQTRFINPTGLDLDETEAGAYSSAYDIAHLMAHILSLNPEMLEVTRLAEIETGTLEGIRHRFENTNEIVNELPGLVASKTGFTDLALGNLAITFDRGLNQPVVVVVLGSSEEGRFNDVKQLVRATLAASILSS